MFSRKSQYNAHTRSVGMGLAASEHQLYYVCVRVCVCAYVCVRVCVCVCVCVCACVRVRK
jgi:hypothetical protein